MLSDLGGRGEVGQLGHGDAEDRLQPSLVSAFDVQKVESILCGADHSTAYSESELQFYSWGWGDFGRLGHGNSTEVFTPQPVKALQGIKIKQIACGDSHCLAVTMNGEVQRNSPKIMETLSSDGLSCKCLKSSNVLASQGKILVSPSERYAVVPDGSGKTNCKQLE